MHNVDRRRGGVVAWRSLTSYEVPLSKAPETPPPAPWTLPPVGAPRLRIIFLTVASPISRKDTPASISDWSVTHVTPIFDSTVYGFDYGAFTGLILAAMVRVRG